MENMFLKEFEALKKENYYDLLVVLNEKLKLY